MKKCSSCQRHVSRVPFIIRVFDLALALKPVVYGTRETPDTKEIKVGDHEFVFMLDKSDALVLFPEPEQCCQT